MTGPHGRTVRPPQRRVEGPRRVRNGLKLRRRADLAPETLPARRWMSLMEAIAPADAWAEGLEYATAGQTVTLAIGPGVVEATVQGRRGKPYETTIRINPLAAEAWERIVHAMAGEAVYLPRLAAGELPDTIETLFGALQYELLPAATDAVTVTCTCGAPGPCKHAAAIARLIGERFEHHPLHIFDLRGMASETVLERLRQARAMKTHGVASAHADPLIPETQIEPMPLEACVESYWGSGAALQKLLDEPPAEYASHALLRRLGPSPLSGRFPLVGLLATIYDTVADGALRLRDHAEHLDGPEEGT